MSFIKVREAVDEKGLSRRRTDDRRDANGRANKNEWATAKIRDRTTVLHLAPAAGRHLVRGLKFQDG